ncbi:class I SAM-dependent methyltransferase [Tateyamaria sp. syn59]|uniref:methyltransferase domain-containing protein n=1 Tax=Tateyamaria sp. syn59 TaxID=2576942 RepID=UPI0011BF05A4|nr:class I SAM-dependent methyltransferase [Tateyamaria sp. syn59]
MDIFGDALRDRQAGLTGRMLTIRRDDGHVDRHDPALYFMPEPFAHEVALLNMVEGPVLDVGCGAGRTLLWLAGQSVAATGIDLSPGAVDVCRDRGCEDVMLADAMTDDLTRQGGPFRTIVVFGNNIGIGGTYEGAETLLRHLAHAAAPGARLLVTGLDVAKTDQEHHLAYHRRNLDKGRPRGEIRMRFEYEGAVGDWVPWYHPEPNELAKLANAAGWRIKSVGPSDGPFYAGVFEKAG